MSRRIFAKSWLLLFLYLHRRLALFSGDFSHELGHLIAGELGADLRDEFSGAFVADFKMGNAFRVVELVQVVGEYTLLEQPAAQAFKCFGVIVHAFQKNALVQECPTVEFKLCENGG